MAVPFLKPLNGFSTHLGSSYILIQPREVLCDPSPLGPGAVILQPQPGHTHTSFSQADLPFVV